MRNHIQAKHIHPTEEKEGPSQERLLAKQNKVQKIKSKNCKPHYILFLEIFLQKQSKVLFHNQIMMCNYKSNSQESKPDFFQPNFSVVTLDIGVRRHIVSWTVGHMCRFR